MKNTGGLLYAARIVPTQTGANIGWPTADDTGVSGTILGEGASAGASVDIVFGQKSLTSYLYSSKPVKASIQLVQDTAIDFAGWLGKRLAVRVARAVNAHLMSGLGPGSSQPTGLLPGVTVGKQGIVGQTTTIIYQDVIDLIHSVDVAYRGQDLAPDMPREGFTGFMCSDGLLKALRGIKDPALGALILNPGKPNTLAGWPLLVSPDMPAPAASAKTLLFGNFPQAYTARRVNDLIVLKLSERVMDQLQLQWIAFDRWDGAPDDPAAIRAYQRSAS
jgi:HK97 family phage major capsid protein